MKHGGLRRCTEERVGKTLSDRIRFFYPIQGAVLQRSKQIKKEDKL